MEQSKIDGGDRLLILGVSGKLRIHCGILLYTRIFRPIED